MNARQILLALLLTGCSLAAIMYVLGREGSVPLIEVETGPRVPVVADSQTDAIVQSGLAERITAEGNAMRKMRNDIARQYRDALAAWRDGRMPLRDVEGIEQMLWVARYRTGEIEKQEMHAALAELFTREHKRVKALHERGAAGDTDLAVAAMFVARERFHAGLPIEDPMGRDYETLRREFLEGFRKTNERLIEMGIGHREALQIEFERLARDFPPVGGGK